MCKAVKVVRATVETELEAMRGAGSVAGGACIICLGNDPQPVQLGCACRGDSGLAHIACRVSRVGCRARQ
jgi:hypothetical protein